VGDVSDRNHVSTLQGLNVEPLPGNASSITSYQDFLYLASRGNGVPIYRTTRDDPNIAVGAIPASQLDGHQAAYVARVGMGLYVGVFDPPKVYVFDLSTPASPIPVTSIDIPVSGAIYEMDSDGQSYLLARTYCASEIYIIDVRNLQSPALQTMPMSCCGAKAFASQPGLTAVLNSTGTRLMSMTTDEQGHLVPRIEPTVIPDQSCYMVVGGSRLYVLRTDMQRIAKYDVSNPAAPYLMDWATTPSTSTGYGFLSRTEGAPATQNALYVRYGATFLVYSP
jgi:hypothetical protein